MDYSNYDEVANAIGKYDRNLGMAFYNLPTEIGNAFSTIKESKYSCAKDKLNELTEKTALETLLILRGNERDLSEEKCNELLAKWQAIPEEKTEENSEAYEAYENENDNHDDLKAEYDELESYIDAQMFEEFYH